MSNLHRDNSIPSTNLLKMMSSGQVALLHLVSGAASRNRLPVYLVGGVVRDLLLGYPATDFDVVVEGDAIRLARTLSKMHGGKTTVHPRFGTARWVLPESLSSTITGISALDLISARSETYHHPAALPTVHFGCLTDDLHRRDFTINTLALRLDEAQFGELYDELGGLEDVHHKMLRALHPQSFIDDPTRLFRLIRYEQRYGFQIAPDTLVLIPEALPGIRLLSAERVRHELDLVVEEENVMAMLQRLAELKILTTVHPDLEWNATIRDRFTNAKAGAQGCDRFLSRPLLGWSLWLMGVSKTGLLAIDKRIHFKAKTCEVLLDASALLAEQKSFSGEKPSQCVARLEKTSLAAVRSVFLALPSGPVRQNLFDYLETWRFVKPKTNGNDLKASGLPPGRSYQTILRTLRDAWLDGIITSVEEEKLLLEKLIKRTKRAAVPKLKA